MGSDQLAGGSPKTWEEFQFTLPHGERQGFWSSAFLAASFQFTLPHGERPEDGLKAARDALKFQFTLPHGERPSSF